MIVEFAGKAVSTPQELQGIVEQAAIVVQVLHADFKSSRAQAVQVFRRDRVPAFGNHLKGGLDSVGVVDVHQLLAKVASRHGFDVVSYGDAAASAIRPKPDEGNAVNAACLEREQQEVLANILDRSVHGPMRELLLVPFGRPEFLNVLAQQAVGKRPNPVVDALEQTLVSTELDAGVALESEIVDDFVWIEWQRKLRPVNQCAGERIAEHGPWLGLRNPLQGTAIAGGARAKLEVSRFRGQFFDEAEVQELLGAAISVQHSVSQRPLISRRVQYRLLSFTHSGPLIFMKPLRLDNLR